MCSACAWISYQKGTVTSNLQSSFRHFPKLVRSFSLTHDEWGRDMTGLIQGLVTRLQQVIFILGSNEFGVCCMNSKFYRVHIWTRVNDGKYYRILTAMIGHFLRQLKLIYETDAMCPLVAMTHWFSVSDVSYFVSDRRLEIVNHYIHLAAHAPGRQSELPIHW